MSIRQARHPTFEFEVIAARGNKLLLMAAGAVESNSTCSVNPSRSIGYSTMRTLSSSFSFRNLRCCLDGAI